MWTVFVTGVLCNFVCGVEESIACGLYSSQVYCVSFSVWWR